MLFRSLTDTVTRVIVRIGVAYDTDMDVARDLMMKTMQDNPRVMRDPAPVVLFLGISANTFDNELRFYVRELGDRNPSIDEVLRSLVVVFRDNHIDMAFNQLDVFIKNNQGQEQLVQSQNPPLTDNQAPTA